MKALLSPVICGILFLFLHACKEKSEKFVVPKTAATDTLDTSQKSQKSQPAYRYVIAPSGLSLRKENSLSSEKLIGMPLGAEVVFLEEAIDNALEVEHIKGGMQRVRYHNQEGYAFSGYLSPVRLLQKEEESVTDYITSLKTSYPEISFESKPNDPDFHEGTTDTFTLPATTWHEVYYLVSAMYDLPKSLGFPDPDGPGQSLVEDPKKPAEAWDSFVTVGRKDNNIQKIEYNYRAEGFGYGITIIRASETLFQVAYLGFVD